MHSQRNKQCNDSTSDVARPLSYKTKTKTTYFFKTKTAFLKTIKLLTQDHWRRQKFWLGEAQIGKIFVTLFWWRNGDDVTEMTS